MGWVRFSSRSLLLGAGFVLGVGCTQVLDFQQCQDDLDCASDEGQPLVCGADSTCVAPPDPSEFQCQRDTECSASFGEDHVCGGDQTCVPLQSGSCSVLYRPDASEIVWLGSILPTGAPHSLGSLQNAVLLAVEDFNLATQLPGGARVGLIGCDSSGTTSGAIAAAEHLADVGVPAIVGPALSENVIAVTEEVAVPEGIAVITPSATARSLTTLADDGLLWRTITSDEHQSRALVDRVLSLDPAPERVLMFAKNDAYGTGLLADVEPNLANAIGPGGFGALLYSDPASFESNDELLNEYGSRIAEAFELSPDTLVVAGTAEARELLLLYLTEWNNADPKPPLPRFIVTHGGVPVLRDVVAAVAPGFQPTLMEVVEGISPAVQDPDNFESYNIRYRIRFMDEEPMTISSLAYDAAMVTLFALVPSVQGGRVDGASVTRALPRLADPSAPRLSFGDEDFISSGAAHLASGGNLDLQGVSGALDFDPTTGDVTTDLIGWTVRLRSESREPILEPARIYRLSEGVWADFE